MAKARSFYGELLRDVLDAIRERDWFTQQVEDNPPYHVFGFKRGTKGTGGIGAQLVGKPPTDDDYASTVAEFLKAARTASSRPDYLHRVRQRYAELGASLEELDRLIRFYWEGGEDSYEPLMAYCLSFGRDSSHGHVTLYGELLEALIVDRYSREGDVDLSLGPAQQSLRQQEVLFFQEAIEKAEKAIARSEPLVALRFTDPLVAEATRCYLYQFYRATVILCATALETRLKSFFPHRDLFREAQQQRKPSYYKYLVSEAVQLKFLPGEYQTDAEDVFAQRHRVAHDGTEPELKTAQKVLDATRLMLEAITPPSA
jgi:hypothetical protein